MDTNDHSGLDYNDLGNNGYYLDFTTHDCHPSLDIVWAKHVVKYLGNHKPHNKPNNHDYYEYAVLALNYNYQHSVFSIDDNYEHSIFSEYNYYYDIN